MLGVAVARGWEPPGDRRLAAALYDAVLGHAYSAELLLDWSAPVGVAASLGLLGWLILRRRLGDAVFVVLAFAGTALIEVVAKSLVRRPSLNSSDPEYSFPSGHVAGAVAIVAIVLLLPTLDRRPLFAVTVSSAAAVVCVLVVARGWHYPSDVVGGVLAAVAWVGLLRAMPFTDRLVLAPGLASGRRDRDRDRDIPG